MPLTLIVALIVLAVIVIVAALGYWIDEAEEPLERGERAPDDRQHHHRV
ncbi:MAG TPA: hypothetical protein VKC35_00665 [Vicinamibacterales bacterium]|nr:hypothetical protein [Vicinamibacterales bacterium]